MLSKLKIGIIGYGRLGKIVKKISQGFQMKFYICDIKMKNYKSLLKKKLYLNPILLLYTFRLNKTLSFLVKPLKS